LEFVQVITLFIALWGAGLSTVKVLFDYHTNRRTLKVDIAYGHGTSEKDGNIVKTLSLIAVNNGSRKVVLDSAGYYLPNKKIFDCSADLFLPKKAIPSFSGKVSDLAGEVKFPLTLAEAERYQIVKSQKRFALRLQSNGYSGRIKLRGYYRSSTGKVYKSKAVYFDTSNV
jgi:hypothetical protein